VICASAVWEWLEEKVLQVEISNEGTIWHMYKLMCGFGDLVL
jgi:hypothetical protein